jgi:Tfp pilus assembly protein PilE
VELIVVIVILAILAAIAIPALTGYIEKAKWQEVELRAKTQLTAVQTMLNERYAKYGGFGGHLTELAAEFGGAADVSSVVGVDTYSFTFNTAQFRSEYENLTGDTYSFRSHSNHQRAFAWADPSGAVQYYGYRDNYFFVPDTAASPYLKVWYFNDIDSPFAAYFATGELKFSTLQAAKDFGLKSGFNIVKDLTDSRPGGLELVR